MEQFIILLIIGLISLVKWILEKSAEHKAARRIEQQIEGQESFEATAEDQREIRPQGDPEEQRRRFMEALGLPTDDPEPEIEISRESVPPPIPERQPARNFLHKVSDDLERRLVSEPEAPEPIVLAPVRSTSSRRRRPVKEVVARTAVGGPVDFLKHRAGCGGPCWRAKCSGRARGCLRSRGQAVGLRASLHRLFDRRRSG